MQGPVWLRSVLAVCASAWITACSAPEVQTEGPVDAPARAGDRAQVPAAPSDPLPGQLNLPSGEKPSAAAGPGLVFWAVDAQSRLLRFDERTPGDVTTTPVTGLLAGEKLLGLDFRPKDKKLLGLGSTSRLYVIDTTTGAATAAGPELVVALSGGAFGFDVDPGTDLARVFSDLDQNIAIDPTTGWVANNDVPLTFLEGDVNATKSPTLVASAFAVPAAGAASAPLYAIDGALGVLTITADPGTGLVTTVGPLDIAAKTITIGGMDIAPNGKAYAAITEAGATALFSIDLTTGHAERLAKIGGSSPLQGLAIQP